MTASLPDPGNGEQDDDVRRHSMMTELSVIRAHGQLLARMDRKGQPLSGVELQRRLAMIDAAVIRIVRLLPAD